MKNMRQKRHELIDKNSWVSHNENNLLTTCERGCRGGIAKSLYWNTHSLCLILYNFNLFTEVREVLEGMYFVLATDDNKNNKTAVLKVFSQQWLQCCCTERTKCWYQHVASQGNYFEGNYKSNSVTDDQQTLSHQI